MDIIRDDMWNTCLVNAVKMYRLNEPDDRCYHLADATWKCKMSYKKHEQKKEDRQIIMIDKIPGSQLVSTPRFDSSKKICSATTMSGKPCSFRAICGDFCKKHRIDKTPIGNKVEIKS